MRYLYLDESGDLGFDFVTKRPSKYFTIAILAINSHDANRKMIKAVRMTIRRKLNAPGHQKRIARELKGTGTTIEVKKYLFEQIKGIDFGVYAITLNKKQALEQMMKDKVRVYTYIAKLVLDQIPFEENKDDRIELILDKSMAKPELLEFNSYIRRQLEGRLHPSVPLDIYHWLSHENCGLQVADLFSWGIFQRYERQDTEWRGMFAKHIRFDDQF